MARVLYIEDDVDSGEAMRDFLRGKGYECTWELDVFHGLKTLLSRPIDIILLDLQLPEVGGLSFLKAVRELGITLPVIVLSAHISIDIEKELKELESVEIFHKPVSFKYVIGKIEEMVLKKETTPYGSLFQQILYESYQYENTQKTTGDEERKKKSEIKSEKGPVLSNGDEKENGEVELIPWQEIEEEHTLAENIVDANNRIMLRKDTVLKKNHINKLKNLCQEGTCPAFIKVYNK